MKDDFFPRGDTLGDTLGNDEDDREYSIWRELSFALHLIRQAVNPLLNMADCLNRWHTIARNLAEPPRKRNYQIHDLVGI